MEERPNYYAVIPANVRYDNELKANEKLLYSEITALTEKTGECWATNKYFADLYGVKNNAVITWIRHLKEKGYIAVDYEYTGKEITKRIITIGPIQKNRPSYLFEYEGGIQKGVENNTSINNKENINNINIINTKERFKKPTLEEVKEYCLERNNDVDAETFINFYESKGWMVGKNKMKDWKACVRTWEKNRKLSLEKTTPDWFDKDLDVEEPNEELSTLLEGMIE